MFRLVWQPVQPMAAEEIFAFLRVTLDALRHRVLRRQGGGGAHEVLGDRPRFLPRAAELLVAGVVLQQEEVRHLRAGAEALGAQIQVLINSGESLAVTCRRSVPTCRCCSFAGTLSSLVAIDAPQLVKSIAALVDLGVLLDVGDVRCGSGRSWPADIRAAASASPTRGRPARTGGRPRPHIFRPSISHLRDRPAAPAGHGVGVIGRRGLFGVRSRPPRRPSRRKAPTTPRRRVPCGRRGSGAGRRRWSAALRSRGRPRRACSTSSPRVSRGEGS